MSEILLTEATTTELITELETRVSAIVCAYELPTVDGHTVQLHKGSYIKKWGLIKLLEGKMMYQDYMCYKDEYNDDPDIFFKDDEKG